MLKDEDIQKILKDDDEANNDVLDRHDAVILLTYDFVKGEERPVLQIKGPSVVLDGMMLMLNSMYETTYEVEDGEEKD